MSVEPTSSRPAETGSIPDHLLTTSSAGVEQQVGPIAAERMFRPPPLDVSSPTIRELLSSTQLLQVKYTSSRPDPYPESCESLLGKIEGAVHNTMNHLNFNGLEPFVKLLNQMEDGKTFRQIRITSENDDYGSTCVGMSDAIIKTLKENGINSGMLAVQRIACSSKEAASIQESAAKPFEHAAVIIECQDGYIFLDPRAEPKDRVFSIPFGSTIDFPQFTLTSARKGSDTPLIVKYPKNDIEPERAFECCTNVANGGDLVLKHFMMDTLVNSFPVSTYDQKFRKTIWVNPTSGEVTFKNLSTTDPNKRTLKLKFKNVLDSKFKQQLSEFMGDDFHVPIDTLFNQFYRLASRLDRIKQLYNQADLDRPS